MRSGSHFGQTTGRFVVGAFAEHFSMSAIENDTAVSSAMDRPVGCAGVHNQIGMANTARGGARNNARLLGSGRVEASQNTPKNRKFYSLMVGRSKSKIWRSKIWRSKIWRSKIWRSKI